MTTLTLSLVLTLVLAGLVGISLGLLGGGGSILKVPVLVYVTGLETKEAIATSLLVVGVTSATGALSHARAGRVRWRTGTVFGAAGMVGAYAGGRLSEYLPGHVLLGAFAVMMAVTALAMLRSRPEVDPDRVHATLPVGRVVLDGAVVGLVTGLVGAGGGFLVVPALALLGGLPMPVAVGTSLVVIAMKSGAGLAGYLSSVTIDWGLAAAVTAAAVAGSLLGGPLAGRIPPDRLRQAFGWFVLVMATFVGLKEAPEQVRTHPVTYLVVLALLAGTALLVRHRSRRSDDPPTDHRHQLPEGDTDMSATTTTQVDVRNAHQRLQDEHSLLVDVREPTEYAAGHAPGAASLPLRSLTADQIPLGVDVMVICRSGGRSAMAAKRLATAGRHALDVTGGMQAWEDAGLPVTTTAGRPGTVA